MLKFGFSNETKLKLSKDFFKKYVDRLYKVLRERIDKKLLKRNGLIDLILVSDATIKKLNQEYRNKNKPTDVISFAYLDVTAYEKEKGDVIVGDVFISTQTAEKQAKEKGHTLKKELQIFSANKDSAELEK